MAIDPDQSVDVLDWRDRRGDGGLARANRIGGGVIGFQLVHDGGDFLHGPRHRDCADDGERARGKGAFRAGYPPHIPARTLGRGGDHDPDLADLVADGGHIADAWSASRTCGQGAKLCPRLYVVNSTIFVADYRA